MSILTHQITNMEFSLFTSSARDLQCLEGIGPKWAEIIIELRNRGGGASPWQSLELPVASHVLSGGR